MDIIWNVVSALEFKMSQMRFENLTADERLIVNQFQILQSYGEWLKSPLANQSNIMVKLLVEGAERKQREFVTECCEKYQNGVAII